MTRHHLPRMPTAPAPPRPALLEPTTWLCFLTIWAYAALEWLGSSFLALSLLLWGLYILRDPRVLVRSLGTMGAFAWLVPMVALLSVLWSHEPLVSARSTIQISLTVTLVLLMANLVPPKRFILCVWVALGIIVVMSLVINNQHYDGMTGRTTMAGVFHNKNTLSTCSAGFALASAAIVCIRDIPTPFRITAFLGIGLGVVVCILARSIAAIGAMGLSLAVLAVIAAALLLPRSMRRAYMAIAVLAGVVAGALLLLVILSFTDDLLAMVGKDSTLTGRTVLWMHADRVTQDNAVLGVGFQAFWRQGFTPAEQIWRVMRIQGRFGFNFHNLYYEILSQLGYVGVAAAMATIIYAGAVTLTWVRRSPDASSGFFMTMFLMIVITQWQAASLFLPFDTTTLFFLVSAAYAASWLRYEAGLRRAMAARQPVPWRARRLSAA